MTNSESHGNASTKRAIGLRGCMYGSTCGFTWACGKGLSEWGNSRAALTPGAWRTTAAATPTPWRLCRDEMTDDEPSHGIMDSIRAA
jgi:hypothetical protein